MSEWIEWVTIKTYHMSHEAATTISYLEAHGIRCFLKDAHLVQIDPFYSNAVGYAKLQVSKDELERAVMLLKEGGYITSEKDYEDKLMRFISKLFTRLVSKFRSSV